MILILTDSFVPCKKTKTHTSLFCLIWFFTSQSTTARLFLCWTRTKHARIKKVPEGVQLWLFFLVDDRGEDPNTTISRPSSTRQRNAISPFKWRFAGVPMMAQHCRYVGLLRLPGRFGSVIQHVDLCMKFTSLFKADKHMNRQTDEMFDG